MKPNKCSHSSDEQNEKLEKLNLSVGDQLRAIASKWTQVSSCAETKLNHELIVCMVIGDKLPPQIYSLQNSHQFSDRFKRNLKRAKISMPSPIQSQIWPSVLDGRSICCVASSKAGKTMAYLVPLMQYLRQQNRFEKRNRCHNNSNQPKVIIICSGFKVTRDVFFQALKVKGDSEFPTLAEIYNCFHYEKIVDKEILISTPSPLLRLIESNVISLANCLCMIFDDGDKTLELHMEAAKSLFALFVKQTRRKCIENSNDALFATPQTMIFAEKWTKEVETFKETQYRPVVVFGNYFEASIANNVNNRVIFVSDESNRGDELLKLLNSLKDIMKNIAVVCRNHCEAIEILQLLSRINIRVYVIDEKTESFKYLSIINQWSNYHSVLIITDQILKSCNRIISKINSTHCLVHYNLPQTKGDFNTRYQLISETIRSPELRKMCTTYIILGPENKLQFFQIYKCLRRIKQEISGEMKAFKKSISRKLCQNYLSFGYCPLKKYFCVLRHSFEASEKANENLPTDGQIKGLITHVVSANEFYMVIEEHRNADHQWQKVDKIATLQQIKQSMETLKKRRNSVKNVIIDEIYAIVVTEKNVVENNVNGNHKNVRNCKSQIQMIINEAFHRVKVLELVENGNKENNVIVKILHIDLGYVTHCKLSDLIELPLHLKQIAPLAHKMYLWGVKPLDNELEWHEKITNIFKKIVMAQNIAYITAWIRLQLNGVFWVDSMKIVTKLKALKVEALSCKPAEVLIEKKFAENNNRQLPNFNNDRERILQKWKCDAQKSLIQNAHLEDTTMVYLSFFKTLHEFYVRNVSFQPCLADLEADISNSITKLVKVKYFFIGLICIVFYEKDNIYNRVRIVDINEDEQIDVYFVDHGETLKVSKDCCFQIDEKFITRLPFQAIKCKLNGIVGNVEPDVVFDYTRLENESFKLILAKKISKENDTNIVRLYVEDEEFEENIRFSLLSKWLFQNKFVEYTSSEEANAEPFMFLAKEEEEEIEEENSMIQLFDFEEFAKSLMKAEENDVKRTPKVESRRKQLMRALQKVQKKKEKVEMEEKEESDEGSPTVMINVPYAPGDFDYEYVQDILPYDPADLDTDEESEHEIFDFDPDYELNSELDMILNNAPKV